MRIAEVYSHLHGEEHLLIHRPRLYEEIRSVIADVDASACLAKDSRGRAKRRQPVHSVGALRREFASRFRQAGGWSPTSCRAATDRQLIHQIASLPFGALLGSEQDERSPKPPRSCRRVGLVKDQVAVEVQLRESAYAVFDLFVKYLLFYTCNIINVGVEVLPVKAMLSDPAGGRRMSTGIAYFEGEVYNVMRHGRNNPPVPLLILGIAP